MRPFDTSPALHQLREAYPSVNAIIAAAKEGDRNARYAIARLWLSEGIPYSFRVRPSIYESLRQWLALKLSVNAKEITVVGSARHGFSLSPGPGLGRPFNERSDLDLTAVSQPLFQRLEMDFQHWSTEYRAATVTPRNPREERFWKENLMSVPNGLLRGFIDPHKIPTLIRYQQAQRVGQVMYEACEKLKMTPEAPIVRKVSVRVYRDWSSFIRQLAINLESAARSAGTMSA